MGGGGRGEEQPGTAIQSEPRSLGVNRGFAVPLLQASNFRVLNLGFPTCEMGEGGSTIQRDLLEFGAWHPLPLPPGTAPVSASQNHPDSSRERQQLQGFLTTRVERTLSLKDAFSKSRCYLKCLALYSCGFRAVVRINQIMPGCSPAHGPSAKPLPTAPPAPGRGM